MSLLPPQDDTMTTLVPELPVRPNRTMTLPSRRWFLTAGIIYVLFSVMDWWLTWLMVGRGGAYEANPLAATVLARFGWLGLAIFKLVLVALVLGVGGYLWSRRPRTARFVLTLGCAAILVVVGYSMS